MNDDRKQSEKEREVRLSLCMIVRDSSRTLGACLESIQPWVDEIVVVDTGSLDETPKIAEQFGARVSYFPWCDDFAAARNESLRHARGQWLFWMDSDDTISVENGCKLRTVADQPLTESPMAYVLQVHCPGLEKHDVTVVDHVKLFRNHPELRFEGRIHEQVLPAVRRLHGEVAWTDIFVVHSGSDQSAAGRHKKHLRDFRLLELELQEKPDHPFVLFNFGMTWADMGEHEKARQALYRCLEVSDCAESHVRKTYALLVGSCATLCRWEEANEICDRGLEQFPRDVELLFRKGIISHQRGRLDDAVDAYQAAMRPGSPRYFSSTEPSLGSTKARHNLAIVYAEMGRLDLAELQWRRIVQELPTHRAAWRGLGESLLKQGKRQTLEMQIEHMPTYGLGTEAKVLRSELAVSQGRRDLAEQLLREAVADDPQDLDALKAICKLLFESGQWTAAECALRDLVLRESDSSAALHNLGFVQLQLGKREMAIRSLQESKKHRPNSPMTDALLQQALARQQKTSDERASHVFQDSYLDLDDCLV